jgi:hypothetical protein
MYGSVGRAYVPIWAGLRGTRLGVSACVVTVRVHSLRGYRPTVTKRGAPTRAGRGEWAPDQRGYANTHPRNHGPRSDAPPGRLGNRGLRQASWVRRNRS